MSIGSAIRKLGLAALLFLNTQTSEIKADVNPIVKKPVPVLERDDKSGIELRLFYVERILKNSGMVVVANDGAGAKKGIESIVLFEDGKRIAQSNGKILITDHNNKKGNHSYHAIITDLEGNKYTTNKRTLGLQNPINLKELFSFGDDTGEEEKEIAEHNLKKGYSPALADRGIAKAYLKNALSIKINGSNVHVPAFKDKKLNCTRCHSESVMKKRLTLQMSGLENMLKKIWGQDHALPKDLVLNPGALYALTQKDIEMLRLLGKTPQEKEHLVKMHQDYVTPGYFSPHYSMAAFRLDSEERVLLHELTHSMMANMDMKLKKDGEETAMASAFISEPFAYYIDYCTNMGQFYVGIINEQEGKHDDSTSQIEYLFGITGTYIAEFNLENCLNLLNENSNIAEEKFAKAELQLDTMMAYALKEYSRNVLTMDTLAIETKSHELPLEAIIAGKYTPFIKDIAPLRLEEGLRICSEVWDSRMLSEKDFTISNILALTDSYYAGSLLGEQAMTNYDDLEHHMKKELMKKGFEKKETLLVYHNFLKNRFCDADGNFSYSPEPYKMRRVTEVKLLRLMQANAAIKNEDLNPNVYSSTENIRNYLKGSKFETESIILADELDRLIKLVPNPIPGNE